MLNVMENLGQLIEKTMMSLGYTGVALLMALENIFPPIPSEVILPMAGFLVSEGHKGFIPILIAGTLGTLLGTSFLYYLGFFLGEQRLRSILKRYGRYFFFPETRYDQALQAFKHYDKSIVFWSRLVPGLRSLISLPAGVARMPLGTFFIYTTLGTLIWNGLLVTAGMLLGHNWGRVMGFVDQFKGVILIAGVGLIAFWLLRKLRLQSNRPS